MQPNIGYSCLAFNVSELQNSASHVADSADSLEFGGYLPRGSPEQSEDCLFADLYIPDSAFQSGAKLPVVVWLYGGAFIFGAKDSGSNLRFYNATGIWRYAYTSKQEFIFVTGNYRLGAFGWLAGPVVQGNGVANAGLWDQRLLLDFVQQYISLVGGDPEEVSIWGESAGAGSIVHHLVSTPPPTFKRAFLQSPAYLWQWDQGSTGHAANVSEMLASKADCFGDAETVLACLRSLDSDELHRFSNETVQAEYDRTGLIAFNPAVDGELIQHLPTVALN